MAEIVVVGSLMIDLVSVTERIPKPGETIHGKSFTQNFGGKGANQCVAAQRLGTRTAMVGSVGDDEFGTQYKREFENSGAETGYLRQISNCRTGIASIWVDASGQNSIIITANANEKLTIKDVREAEKVIKDAKILICQLEVAQEASLEALRIAKQHGVRSIFNPAPATSDLNSEFWGVLDIICPNETEAELLCGFPVDSEQSYQRAIDFLLEKGAENVVLTLGEKGAVFATKRNPKLTRVTASKVKVIDSTGAGDAFIGAMAHFLVKNPDGGLQKCIENACKYASLSVQIAGTQPSFAKMEELSGDFFLTCLLRCR